MSVPADPQTQAWREAKTRALDGFEHIGVEDYDALIEAGDALATAAERASEKDTARWDEQVADYVQQLEALDAERYEAQERASQLEAALEGAQKRLAAIEREADMLSGDENRPQLAVTLGLMSGMAQRGKEEADAILAVLSPSDGNDEE